MAQVPTPRGQSVAPAGPDRPYISVSAPAAAFGAPIAEGLAGVANETGQIGQVLADHSLVMQGLANKADSDTAYVSFVKSGNDLRTKFVESERGGSALPALPQYQTDMEKARTEAGASLNPMAKRMYEADSRRLFAGFDAEMSRHAAQQNREYTVASSDAKMDTAANLAVQNAGNPFYLDNAKSAILKESGFQAEYRGLGPDVAKNVLDTRVSKLYSNVIEQLANDDPPSANAYFEAHKSEMIGNDIKVMDNYLKRTMQPYIATQIADSVANGSAGGAPLAAVRSDPKGFFSRLAGGEVQVTSTVRTPEHNAAVGGVKNSEHQEAYGFAVDMTPPAGMTTAQLTAKLKGSNLGAHQILNEGDHVHVGWAKSAGNPADSIMGAVNLEELESRRMAGLKAVDTAVDQHYGGDPTIKAAAETRFDAMYGRRYAAMKAQTDGSRDRVISSLIDDPAAAPKDLPSLFASYPGAQNDYLSMTPTMQKAVQGELRANANPQMRDMSAAQRQTWAYLDGESKTNPAAFAARNLMGDADTAGLPFSTLQQFIRKQNDLKAGKGIEPNEQRMMSWAAPFLKDAKIEKTDPEYSKFMSALTQNAKAYYDINKKYPDEQWVRNQTQSLMLTHSTGFLSSSASYELPDKDGLIPGVPNAFTQAMIAQAHAQGVQLSNVQILQLYNRKSGNGGR